MINTLDLFNQDFSKLPNLHITQKNIQKAVFLFGFSCLIS